MSSPVEPVGRERRAQVADEVTEAALAVPGVAGLSGGRFGEVATYLPGRRIVGVRLGDEEGAVHIIADLHRPILETAEEVRVAVEHVTGTPMTVIVEDVATSGED